MRIRRLDLKEEGDEFATSYAKSPKNGVTRTNFIDRFPAADVWEFTESTRDRGGEG